MAETMIENNVATEAASHAGVLTGGECGTGCCTHEVRQAPADPVSHFEAGRRVWSVATSAVYVVESVDPAQGSQVMVKYPTRAGAFPAQADELVPLPNPGETVCLNVAGGPTYGIVLDVAPASGGMVALAWASASNVRRETFAPAVLDIAATSIRVPDRDPSVVTLVEMLNRLDERHTNRLDYLIDEAAHWAIREDVCSKFEAYLDDHGLPVPEREWTVRGEVTFEFTVTRSFRDEASDVVDSVTADEIADALDIPAQVVRALEYEVREAERDD